MHCGLTLVQMWQKLESIESFAKKQSQQQNGINNKFTVLKEQYAVTIAPPTIDLGNNGGQREVMFSSLQQKQQNSS